MAGTKALITWTRASAYSVLHLPVILGKNLFCLGRGADCQELLEGLVKQTLSAVWGSWVPLVCGSSVLFGAATPQDGRAVS